MLSIRDYGCIYAISVCETQRASEGNRPSNALMVSRKFRYRGKLPLVAEQRDTLIVAVERQLSVQSTWSECFVVRWQLA